MRFATFGKIALFALLLLVSFGMIQCDEGSSVGGVQCLTSMDCDLNFSCQLGRCVSNSEATLCNSDGDCADGYICVEISADQKKCIAEIETCSSDLECGVGYSCVDGFCNPDESATTCTSNEDCPSGYSCAEMTGGGYKCIPGSGGGDQPVVTECGDACNSDGTCDGSNCFCCDSVCITKFPVCSSDDDCYTGQVCLTSELVCTLEPSSCEKNGGSTTTDGDDEQEEAAPTCTGLIDTEVCGENEVCCNSQCKSYVHSCTAKEDCYKGQTCTGGVCTGTPESCEMNDPAQQGCTQDSDCPDTQHCGGVEGGGIGCVNDCSSDGDCEEGASCNPNNGRCEFCQTECPASQCCNYNLDFWYCGQCCVPACPLGQACHGGNCVDLACPDSCDTCEICGPETGYVCERDPNGCGEPEADGDTDVESRRNVQCLDSNAPCTAGVDECCSGTCLMGTCL